MATATTNRSPINQNNFYKFLNLSQAPQNFESAKAAWRSTRAKLQHQAPNLAENPALQEKATMANLAFDYVKAHQDEIWGTKKSTVQDARQAHHGSVHKTTVQDVRAAHQAREAQEQYEAWKKSWEAGSNASAHADASKLIKEGRYDEAENIYISELNEQIAVGGDTSGPVNKIYSMWFQLANKALKENRDRDKVNYSDRAIRIALHMNDHLTAAAFYIKTDRYIEAERQCIAAKDAEHDKGFVYNTSSAPRETTETIYKIWTDSIDEAGR